ANGIEENPMAGAISLLFGNVFSLPDESHMINTKGWQVIGSEKALNVYMTEGFLNNTLKLQMADCNISGRIPSRNCNFFMYWCPSNDPGMISSIFKKEAADAFKSVIKGVGFVPSTLSITDGGNINIDFDRLNITKCKAPIVERDTTVVIPQGPFKVKNSATGETNYLSQAANLYLSLKDENGKGIWSVPFKEKICGSVESIDWYQNGKIQFLFGAGSSLHLVDRIGRFVNPFPVDLGKEILIGPAAYDFSGVGGYTAVILHKDNTIELYNLHGKKPEHWKGITSTETIKSLPELLEVKGKKYWVVRTGLQTQIYGFNGGEPLTKNEGDKMIRPDSQINVDEKGNISAICYDGKERNIKF
ncbi:MAG: hypothetical protein MJZ16_09545, partial [Bacteroidales bacterium]|nr:hypothetical protein [Bacteroidales bacterium]